MVAEILRVALHEAAQRHAETCKRCVPQQARHCAAASSGGKPKEGRVDSTTAAACAMTSCEVWRAPGCGASVRDRVLNPAAAAGSQLQGLALPALKAGTRAAAERPSGGDKRLARHCRLRLPRRTCGTPSSASDAPRWPKTRSKWRLRKPWGEGGRGGRPGGQLQGHGPTRAGGCSTKRAPQSTMAGPMGGPCPGFSASHFISFFPSSSFSVSAPCAAKGRPGGELPPGLAATPVLAFTFSSTRRRCTAPSPRPV